MLTKKLNHMEVRRRSSENQLAIQSSRERDYIKARERSSSAKKQKYQAMQSKYFGM